MKSELLTIIIPVYNRPQLIERCLDSVYAQEEPVRVVVVDNASTDDTVAHVECWRDAHRREGFELILLSEERKGAAAARQRGFEALRSISSDNSNHSDYSNYSDYSDSSDSQAASRLADDSIVLFFDSDDTMRPGLLKRVREIFGAEPETDVVTWLECVHGLDGKERISKRMKGHDPLERHLVHAVLSTQRYAVRAGLFERVGGWRPEIMVWNDWETGIRVLMQRPRIHAIDEPLVDVYSQAESITGTGFSGRAGEWEDVLDEGLEDLCMDREWGCGRYPLIIEYRAVILAAHYCREGRPDLGNALLRRTLKSDLLRPWHKPLLRGVYDYTRLGGRGAYSLVRFLLHMK